MVSLLFSYWSLLTVAIDKPVLSVACNPETNTVVSGTELASSQAVVAFWYVSYQRGSCSLDPLHRVSEFSRSSLSCQCHELLTDAAGISDHPINLVFSMSKVTTMM